MITSKVVFLMLMTLSLGIGIAQHGKKRTPTNGWVSFINYIITLLLLLWCGFFN